MSGTHSPNHERRLRSVLSVALLGARGVRELIQGRVSSVERVVDGPGRAGAALIGDALSHLEEAIDAVWVELGLDPLDRSVRAEARTLATIFSVDLHDLESDRFENAYGPFPDAYYRARIAAQVAALRQACDALNDAASRAFQPEA